MRWLLRFLVKDVDRQAIESDLAELYELRRHRDGDRAAAGWRRRQRLLYPILFAADGWRAAIDNGRVLVPHLWQDLLYSLRSLGRTPALAATLVLTVGVGLGATTAMLSVVRTVLLNPLPYAGSDDIFVIHTDSSPHRFPLSVVDYRALEADHPAFSSVAAYQTRSVTVTDGVVAERVTSRAVTGSYFRLLGQAAATGRLFEVADDRAGDRTAVLTAAYWARRFGSDPGVLGRTLTVDGAGYTIVGVLQRTDGPLEQGVALFTVGRWPTPTRKGPFFLRVLGRLREGVSIDAAGQTLRATNARLFPLWRTSYQSEKATWGMQPLKDRVVGDVSSTLLAIFAAVACVLLIACANAVNLLIGRALNRTRELAIGGRSAPRAAGCCSICSWSLASSPSAPPLSAWRLRRVPSRSSRPTPWATCLDSTRCASPVRILDGWPCWQSPAASRSAWCRLFTADGCARPGRSDRAGAPRPTARPPGGCAGYSWPRSLRSRRR